MHGLTIIGISADYIVCVFKTLLSKSPTQFSNILGLFPRTEMSARYLRKKQTIQ